MGRYLEIGKHMSCFAWDGPGMIISIYDCIKIIKENNLVDQSKFYFT